ncbi:MAG: penicillin-binding protein activator LpoB [Deltaproteobacteria bacterium]|nr:penicillin-binding protein activator LpoB [Deltaproteobacteria bacterium]
MKTRWLSLLLVGLVVSCGDDKKVTRVSESEVTDISDKWNDTDSRLVAQEMISSCLGDGWVDNATKELGKKPVVIVQLIKNKASEHIAVGTFAKDLERMLIKDGRIKFVASASERESIRAERADQADNASDDTMNSGGKELGANFALKGSIEVINQRDGGTQVKFYQVNLELISLSDNSKAWIGDKKIKKVINQAGAKW